MAATLTVDKVNTRHLTGLRLVTGTLAFDSSYPTGGEAISLPLNEVKGMFIENKSGYMFEYDRINKKVKAFHPRAAIANTLAASVDAGATSVTSTAANGAIITLSGVAGVAAGPGAEVPNLTDLSALTDVGFLAWGW